jgi:hypothetical protein
MKRSWTAEEDGTLTDLVRAHGKRWALIATRLPDRSASQVAARWEKCLDPNIRKGPFGADEDMIVRTFVAQHGPRNWSQLSALLPHRGPKQCRERWFNHLDPSVVKADWTPQEDQVIFREVERIGPKWSTIAKMIPGRSDNAIKNRWNSSLSKRIQLGVDRGKMLVPEPSKRKKKSKKGVPCDRKRIEIPLSPAAEAIKFAPFDWPPALGLPLFLSPAKATADQPFTEKRFLPTLEDCWG